MFGFFNMYSKQLARNHDNIMNVKSIPAISKKTNISTIECNNMMIKTKNDDEGSKQKNEKNVNDKKMDTFLLSLENKYDNEKAYTTYNEMYRIGLLIAIKCVNEGCDMKEMIREYALKQNTKTGKHNKINEIEQYDKKQMIKYIIQGVEDGMSPEYIDTYNSILNDEHIKTKIDDQSDIVTNLNGMCSKYTDSINKDDIEKFYDFGVVSASNNVDKNNMISMFEKLINEKSKDDVWLIHINKKHQIIRSLNEGHDDFMCSKIKNAYDINGEYNYKNKYRKRLNKRARIDAVIAKKK